MKQRPHSPARHLNPEQSARSPFSPRPFSSESQPESPPGGPLATHSIDSLHLSASALPAPRLAIQPRLTVGRPDDPYEREADRVAATVVRSLRAPAARAEAAQHAGPGAAGGVVQRSSLPDAAPAGPVAASVGADIQAARGGGQPLAPALRAQMGQAMGADFSAVRAHTDARADQLSQSIQATAFTVGQDVFFRQGAYDPGSRAGQELIAHELTHVVQQRRGGITAHSRIQRKPPRRTESRILGEMAQGNGSLSNANSDDLIEKMDKGQTNSKARAIAAQTEAEADQLVGALPDQQQQQVRAAIRDYVASSTAIQTDARNNPNAPGLAVQALDAALAAIRQQLAANNASNERIVYRSISYNSGADIPYGHADQNGNIINVGDFVGDKGFLSTSEHRQFVLGKEQTGAVQGLLKLAIHGKTGVPIAINIPAIAYSNTNQKALYDMQQASKNKLVKAWNKAFGAGAGAGQAEVLFSRDTVFEVKKIQRNGDTVSVVLEEHTGPRPPSVLSMKYGTAI